MLRMERMGKPHLGGSGKQSRSPAPGAAGQACCALHGASEGRSVPSCSGPAGAAAGAPKGLGGPRGFSRWRGRTRRDASHAASSEVPSREVIPSALCGLADPVSGGLNG